MRKLKYHILVPQKGKLEQGETEDSCAIREVEEETGFNIGGHYDPALYFEENYPNTLRYYLLIYVLAICIIYHNMYVCMIICMYVSICIIYDNTLRYYLLIYVHVYI